ncbi:MAG TPA: S41 family peptidase [Acidobacteriota bacterium]|nr:S41 family peptidase [Acidobacteriota bacterium]
MVRYSVQLFGITLFALALIWFAGPGDASQTAGEPESVLWADTVHINLNETTSESPEPPLGDRDTFLKNVKKLTQASFSVRNHYMEDVDVEQLIKSGIVGMLSDLDRFSVLMEKSSYDALMESTHGKYSGLGMQIDARDGHIVIISPIEGTPAYRRGLRAGDIIWMIDGESTEDMNSSDAAELMRGDAGTSVMLQIKRAGIADLLEFEVERAVIALKSVNYSGVIPGTDIGYVRLSRFAEETGHELRTAISDLNKQDVSSLILDLRSNGGGLLDQAKEVAELFLTEGREIVYTKGRDISTERHYVSERPPLLPQDKPIVVLVDAGTASASEIVAGAIQDWDRGIIMGSTTYGKGLVQQIFPVANDGSLALKLTTAKYYVPSGRCIQKPEKQSKEPPQHPLIDEEQPDSLVVGEKEVFYTNGGRIVYGGGGIIPDVEIDRETWKTIEINLERKSMFFDFAVQYVADHPDIRPDFEVTDEIAEEFRGFIKDKEFTYKSALQVALEDMRQTITEEDKEEVFQSSLDELSDMVEREKSADFEESLLYVKRALKREIVSSVFGERGVYENVVLTSDKAVQEAVRLLSTPQEYSKLMTTEAASQDL